MEKEELMKLKIFVVLIITCVFFLNGCGPSFSIVKKVPRTQENLQAYRECQRTVIVARIGDKLENDRLLNNCLKTLDTTVERVEGYPSTPPGCEKLVELREYLNSETIYYYLCK
jgi:hypothetical protein